MGGEDPKQTPVHVSLVIEGSATSIVIIPRARTVQSYSPCAYSTYPMQTCYVPPAVRLRR